MRLYIFFTFSSLIIIFGCTSQFSRYRHEISKFRTERYEKIALAEKRPFNKEDIKHIKFYEIKDAYKCKCTLELVEKAKPFEMPTYSNSTQPYVKYAIATCPLLSKELKLTIYKSLRQLPVYADYLFLPFKDQTNDDTTYGGGRYLDFKSKDIVNGILTVDFNKAYNPYCAYSDGFNCPIPPLENHLETRIEAGELDYLSKH